MVAIDAPRFDLDEVNSEAERDFVAALHSRAESCDWYADGWPRDDRVIVTVNLCDSAPEHNVVLRMLRADFDGTRLLMGPDETSQLATDLDPARDDVTEKAGMAPAEFASLAAAWLEREMKRPLERLEWNRRRFTHRIWRYADTGQQLVWSDSQNKKRENLGPPDKVAKIQ